MRSDTKELEAFERQLRRSAMVDTGDAELAGLFGVIRARRARRSRGPAGAATAREAPTDTAPTDTARVDEAAPTSGAPGTILSIDDVAPSVRIVRVAKPSGYSYTAGQHVKLGVPGVDERRSYSLASAPHDPHLEFCVELVPGGRVTPTLFGQRSGDVLDVGPAKGSFVLDGSADTHLFVATVTGIAPLRGMLRDALRRGVGTRFVVLHGASCAEELPYRAELEELAARDERVEYVPTVSRPSEPRNRGWTGHTGRVDPLAEDVAATLEPRGTTVYACGNGGMIANVKAALGAHGFSVRSEAFD